MKHCGDLLHACGLHWDASDIARFLSLCELDPATGCLLWLGAKSRGQGNTHWYGSFTPTGHHSVRAHKFFAVAILGLRPERHVHHLDHTCQNTLCVCHIECVSILTNLHRRWSRASRATPVSLATPPPGLSEVSRSA